MKIIKTLPVIFIGFLLFNSCTQEPEKQLSRKQPVPKKLFEPFRFHKAIEVKPGLTLDILSWGRGSNATGGYLILRSDSTHLEYKSVSGELDGEIVDIWVMDLDSDGDPELYIHARGAGEGSYLTMYVYEYNDRGNARKIPFPSLSASSKKSYKGNDSIYVKLGRLIREFPVKLEDDTSKSLRIEKLEYTLSGNSFNVKKVSDKEED